MLFGCYSVYLSSALSWFFCEGAPIIKGCYISGEFTYQNKCGKLHEIEHCLFSNVRCLNVNMARQSEITRKLDKSVILDDEGTVIEDKGALPRSEIPQGEHPLSLGKNSIWNQFFQV